jgi:hypothetical protein
MSRKISMKKIYLFCIFFVVIKTLFGQVVFTNNFNTSTGATYSTTPGGIGTSTVWNFNRSGVDFGTRIDGGILDCTNDGSATSNVTGWVFSHTSTSSFTSPFNTTLNANTSKITWTFNMRQIRTDPAGFVVGSYGVAFILAGSASTGATAGSGYAVALGQSGTTDPIRLIKYNNGVQGTITNIITSNTLGLTDFGAEYLSIKITYIPSTDTWELFVRNDGTTAFADPATGVLISQGTAVDNTFTSQVLGFMGGYWQGTTAATQTAFFDNINVSLASTNSTNSDIIADGAFSAPTNINYSLYQGTVLTLANSVEVAGFSLRDGGVAANDADVVGTTLTAISFSLTNSANIRRVAIMDGSTQLAEVAGAATINFSGLNIVAADDGSKNFSLRVVFANNVTDNLQYQFAVSSVSADVAGSQFAASNAGGATSSITGDNNRIEVIADGLSYVVNTFSPTGNGVAMAPAVQIGGTDTLNFGGNLYTNLDADFNQDIAITSTGILTGTTVILPPTAGLASFTTLTHTINGTALTLTAKRNTTNDWDAVSNPFDIINASNTTDYFRSVQNGNWNNPITWESSPDNIGWQASTLTPNSLANTITIRNTDTVTITTSTDADQLSIENGGKLIQNNTPIFTINNGTALYDMTVEIGGTFEMNGRQPIGAGSIIIAGGGRIRIASNPSPNEGDDFAYGSHAVASVIFSLYSYYDWATTTSPEWSGRNYFTTGSNTYFTFLTTPSLGVGGNSPTLINGVLVATDTITILGTGTKIFVNGIINAALIDAQFAAGGSLNITGTGAALGDTGTILLPPAGLNIGASTVIGCTTNPATPTKTINGNVNFSVNSYLFLTDTDLTITGSITGTSSTAFFITNGLSNAGKLFRPNIGATPVIFPIGFSTGTYNPVTISNASNLTYGVRVSNVINPPIIDDSRVVNRTWVIIPSATPAGPVNVIFNYAGTHANPGFNYGLDVEVGLYTSVWNVIQTGLAASGSDPYDVATIINAFGANIEAPIIIGNLGSILSVQKSIQLTAVNQNNIVKLNWTTTNIATVKQFIIEYSTNGINYFPLSTKNSSTFSFVDDRPLNQKNYYRIKGIGLNNLIVYSNIISINSNSLTSVFLTPSSTTSSITLNANSNKQQTVQLVLVDAVGKQLEQQTNPLAIGQNRILKNVAYLSKGIYYMVVYYSNGDKSTLRFIKM